MDIERVYFNFTKGNGVQARIYAHEGFVECLVGLPGNYLL